MASSTVDSDLKKPHVLVLGGLGFIGRNLVDYLVTNGLTRKIVVTDKVLPEMAWLSPKHKKSFEKITFQQVDLIKPNSVASLFMSQNTDKFDYVFNCAGETRPWLPMRVYEDGVYTLSVNCAREAAKHDVKCFVELSCAELWSRDEFIPGSCCSITCQKSKVERELTRIAGLNFVVVRLTHVYGLADVHGFTPYFIFGGISRHLKEPLQMFWCSTHQYYTVNVLDVARALFHVCLHGKTGRTYTLADDNNTSQGFIADMACKIFETQKSFLGVMTTNFIKMNREEMLVEVMEKYLPPWTDACSREGIFSTPLYPHINEDIIHHRQYDLPKDRIPGFECERPIPNVDVVTEALDYYLDLHLFPRSLVPGHK